MTSMTACINFTFALSIRRVKGLHWNFSDNYLFIWYCFFKTRTLAWLRNFKKIVTSFLTGEMLYPDETMGCGAWLGITVHERCRGPAYRSDFKPKPLLSAALGALVWAGCCDTILSTVQLGWSSAGINQLGASSLPALALPPKTDTEQAVWAVVERHRVKSGVSPYPFQRASGRVKIPCEIMEIHYN